MKRLLLLTLALATLTGCMKQPGDDPGPRHRWFNPYGQEVEEEIPEQCPPDAQVPTPPDLNVPPPEGTIPKGWHTATYHLNIDALKWSGKGPLLDFEYCIPVSIYAYITAGGLPGEVIETRAQGVTRHTTPWNGLRTTPWRSSIIVAWAPDSPRPVMNFELSAKYEIGEGLSRAPAPQDGTVALSCSIKQNNNTITRETSIDIYGPQTGNNPVTHFSTGPFVRCRPEAFSAIPT